MKRIFEGKTYNTDTATRIAELFDHDNPEDYDSLYRTRHGAFFRYFSGETRYGDTYEDIRPLSPAEAQSWLEKGNFVDEIEEFFGEQPEAGEAESRITVRVPDSLKSRIEVLAAANNQSLNAWIMRCLETCANSKSQSR